MSLSKTKYRKKKLKKSNRKRKYSPKNQTRRKRRTRKYKKQKGGGPDGAGATTASPGTTAPASAQTNLEDQIKALIKSLTTANLAKALVDAQAKAEEAKSDAVKKVNKKERREDVKVIIYDSLGNKIKFKFKFKIESSIKKKNLTVVVDKLLDEIFYLKLINEKEILTKYKLEEASDVNNTYLDNIFEKPIYLTKNKDQNTEIYYNYKVRGIEKFNKTEDIERIVREMITFLGIFVFENIKGDRKNYSMDINIKFPSELEESEDLKVLNPGNFLGNIMNHVYHYNTKKKKSRVSDTDISKNLIEIFDNLGYSIEYKNKFRYILTINPT